MQRIEIITIERHDPLKKTFLDILELPENAEMKALFESIKGLSKAKSRKKIKEYVLKSQSEQN